MNNQRQTEHEVALIVALEKRGLIVEAEHSDGFKHVDMFIPAAKIYIEVDGLQHFTDPHQIIADFHRDYYSNKDGFFTFRVTNQLVDTHLEEVADAIAKIVAERGNKYA